MLNLPYHDGGIYTETIVHNDVIWFHFNKIQGWCEYIQCSDEQEILIYTVFVNYLSQVNHKNHLFDVDCCFTVEKMLPI